MVSFSQPKYSAFEFTEEIPVTVNVTGNYNEVDPSLNLTIAVELSGGTATSSVDYIAKNYSFTPNPPSYKFTIMVVDEDVAEDDETIELDIRIPSDLSGIVRIGDIPSAEAVIIDDCESVSTVMTKRVGCGGEDEGCGGVGVRMRDVEV